MNDVKLKSGKHESNLKNAEMFKEHFNDIQNDFSNKEKELTQKFKDRENKMKNSLNDEITSF